MILKQNCFVITDNELDALEEGSYREPQRVVNRGKGLEIITDPVTYCGSSIQRRNYKASKPNDKKKVSNIEHSLSGRSKTKIAQKVLAWANASNYKGGSPRFTFLTLTLTSQQNGNDSQFTQMQNVFFTYCRKYFGLTNYLYVLERQTKTTNNIHSHILIDRPLPIVRLNKIWCKILSDHGYTYLQTDLTTGAKEVLPVSEAWTNSFKSEKIISPTTGKKVSRFTTPSPADIAYIYDLKAVSRYVTKYITKNETKILTSIWNCSQSISRLWTGAKISAVKHYVSLREHTAHIIRVTLDEGHVLNIHLLTQYTGLQKRIFETINKQYLIT